MAVQRARVLRDELAALTPSGPIARVDAERLRRELRRHAADVRRLLGQDVAAAREVLRQRLVGPLECRAFDEGGGGLSVRRPGQPRSYSRPATVQCPA